MFSLREPSTEDLAALVRTQVASGALSYDEVGATAGQLPLGYRHDRWETDLGADDPRRFRRSADALRNWQPQRGAGLRIFPDTPVAPDASFALVISLGLGFATACGRVLYVVDASDRYQFAYGTLLAHPEQGEESFAVTRRDGRVRFEIVAFSRPRHILARMGAPIARSLQVRVTRSYLQAMREVGG